MLGLHRYLTDNKDKSELIYSINKRRRDSIDLRQNGKKAFKDASVYSQPFLFHMRESA